MGQRSSLLLVTMAPLTTSSLRSMSNLFYLFIMDCRNLLILLEYRAEDWPDILDGRSVYPIILTPLWTTILSFSVSSQFPPVSAARSTITLPGLMSSTICLVMSLGAGLPGIRAVVMMMSTYSHCLANSFISA